MELAIPRIVIAGTHSGVGKTTLTLGILRALARRGLRLQSFKVGPDFLDPTYHREVLGIPSGNLDSWMAGPAFLRENLLSHSRGKDMAVIEGVMGLFDGRPPGEEGSTAETARLLKAPVILVVDCRGMAASAAAQVLGYHTFHRSLRLRGVILNRTGSRNHFETVKEAVESRTGVPVLGGFPRDEEITLAHRHLGLVSATGESLPQQRINRLARMAEEHLDLARLVEIARSAPPLKARMPARKAARPGGVRIGIAWDDAFHFYYRENLELLESSGAELVRFSPLMDEALPAGIHGIYLGGGYPELHLPRLSANGPLMGAIRAWAFSGRPLYAECGGLLYLLDEVSSHEGEAFPMAGVFPFTARLAERFSALGYVEVEAAEDNLLFPAGATVRGHEFHYTAIVDTRESPGEVRCAYRVRTSRGDVNPREGFSRGNTLASYVHLYFPSYPASARNFVRCCRTSEAR